MTVNVFVVGGFVRDKILGLKAKDVDFAVEAASFDAMRAHLISEGFKIFLEKEEFLTIRAGIPLGHDLREFCKDADFVLCRKDGPSMDGRRPDFVEPGNILDDLARRDFTINAMAIDQRGKLIDPHGGAWDCERKILRFVGEPADRIREDGLRILRGLRFIVTKGLSADDDTMDAIRYADPSVLRGVSDQRITEELNKMFRVDSARSVWLLNFLGIHLLKEILKGGVRLSATLKQ